jgi:hypothetical protein
MVALLVVAAATAPAEGPWAARDVARVALVVAGF